MKPVTVSQQRKNARERGFAVGCGSGLHMDIGRCDCPEPIPDPFDPDWRAWPSWQMIVRHPLRSIYVRFWGAGTPRFQLRKVKERRTK